MKRILSVVLSVIMAFSAMSVSFGAYASEQTRGGGLYDFMSQSSSDGNVLTAYFDHKLRNSADPTVLQNSKSVKYKGTYYYSDGYQLYNRMRVNIDNRDENVTLYYLADGKLGDTKIKNTLKNTMFNACDARISKTTTDGDYAYWIFTDSPLMILHIIRAVANTAIALSLSFTIMHQRRRRKW